jgi:hypothetical protein
LACSTSVVGSSSEASVWDNAIPGAGLEPPGPTVASATSSWVFAQQPPCIRAAPRRRVRRPRHFHVRLEERAGSQSCALLLVPRCDSGVRELPRIGRSRAHTSAYALQVTSPAEWCFCWSSEAGLSQASPETTAFQAEARHSKQAGGLAVSGILRVSGTAIANARPPADHLGSGREAFERQRRGVRQWLGCKTRSR